MSDTAMPPISRNQLGKLLGIRSSEPVPITASLLWRRPHPLGVIEKIVFAADDGEEIPAYVCLPAKVNPPYRFAICLQGHSTGMHNSIGVACDNEEQNITVEGDRDFALGCMQRGVAALCIEQRAFGERSVHAERTPSCHQPSMRALMRGHTLLGLRVLEIGRALGYLFSRDDVMVDHIGIMGNSGGGTTALFAAAIYPQIAWAMPASCFCTFEDSIMAVYHCVCNYVPDLLNHAEMADVAGLIAPRPLVIVHGQQDEIFPIRGTQQAMDQLLQIYRKHDASPQCHLVIGDGGHRFYAEQAWNTLLPLIDGK
jgi:dienelactone hydrolase